MTRPTKLIGPREQIFAIYGKGFFEGGPKVRGDVVIPISTMEEKPAPFRPSRHLKGIPITERIQRRRALGESYFSSLSVFFARVLQPLGSRRGFTLIELVMVLLLLAVLAAVAIPNFQDFRSDARNASTRGSLGGLRSAIAIARAAIALKEDVGPPSYPTVLELQSNAYDASHPVLAALATQNKRIFDASGGVPVNPWSLQTIPFTQQSSIWDCASLVTKSFVRSGLTQSDFGWCYNQTTGEFWANSDRNGSVSPNTENRY